ncbi:MAG: hypothetical protein J5755_01195, partial [Clostridia bacterium]|nr:hypothetical protein [Clostridia bacterium]
TAAEAKLAQPAVSGGIIAGLVIVCLLLVCGAVLLGLLILQLKGKKTLSVGFLPILLGAAAIGGPMIALIVLIVLTVGVLAADVVLAIKHPGILRKIFGKEKEEPKPAVEEEPEAAPIVASGEPNKGYYRITRDGEGKCTFTLFYEDGDHLSKEMGPFKTEKIAYRAIKTLRDEAQNAGAENRVHAPQCAVAAPKFVLDVDSKGVYKYSFVDEDGNILLQSVQYLNEKRCLKDLKKTLACIGTEEIRSVDGEVKEDVIEAVEEAPVAPQEEVKEEPVQEPVAEEPVEEDQPVEEQPAEDAERHPEPVEGSQGQDETEVEEAQPIEEPQDEAESKEEPHEEISLKESLAKAKEAETHKARSKADIAKILSDEFGDKVELNTRGNETKTGLPLADTHYFVEEDGKSCFVYVYETNGTVVLLLRLEDEDADKVREQGHELQRSAFPKSKHRWYSVVLDDEYSDDDIRDLFAAAYGADQADHEEQPKEEPQEEQLSLKESLALAKETKTHNAHSKADIVKLLQDKFGDKVEINTRGNETKTGLPLADTHYALGEEGKKCFIYVYETGGTLVMLLRLDDEFVQQEREELGIQRSAFPKSKDAWYSVVVSDNYTEDDLDRILAHAFHSAE